MEWSDLSIETRATVTELAFAPGTGAYATTSDGRLLRLDLRGGVEVLARVPGALRTVVARREEVLCAGEGGRVLRHARGATSEASAPSEANLFSLAVAEEEVLAVGRIDRSTGIVLRSGPSGSEWSNVAQRPAPPALLVARNRGDGGFLVAGERGYLAALEGGRLTPLATGTRHPLRALWASRERWVAAGGGWAQTMPVVVVGGSSEPRTLLRAGGDRVVVGLARGPEGSLWAADNRSDGITWRGSLGLLSEGGWETMETFPGRLAGLALSEGRLAVFGERGMVRLGRLAREGGRAGEL